MHQTHPARAMAARAVPVALVAALLFAPTLRARAAAPRARSIEGVWRGELRKLRVILHIEAGPRGTLRGTLDSPDQNATGLLADAVTLTRDSLHVDMHSIGARYDGKWSAAKKTITGLWQQGTARVPLVLTKAATTAGGRRPQDPVPPYPYRSENVMYGNRAAGVRLAGTLTIPRGAGPFPAVLLLSGSGPQNRDGEVFGHRPFLVLADYLTRRGIAVLRVDDRGVGGSTGRLSRATISDLSGDALAGVAFLRSRKEIDPGRIGLIGHSEGGMVAPLAATRSRGAVKFIVMMAGVGIPGDELVRRQSAAMARMQGVNPEVIEKQDDLESQLYTLLKSDADSSSISARAKSLLSRLIGILPENRIKAAGGMKAVVARQMEAVFSPAFRSMIAFDPARVLAEVRCPVLALGGSKDVQVPTHDNLLAIKKAVESGGHATVTTVDLPGLNHLLQTCKTGSVAEYSTIDETIAPAALETMAKWIETQTGLAR